MLGGILTATIIWVMSGLVRGIPDVLSAIIVIAFSLAAVTRDFRIVWFKLPQNDRQVPETLFAKGAVRSSFQFGFELGTGVRTKVTTATPYVAALAVMLYSPEMWTTVLVGAGFGLGRAVMPTLRYTSWDRVAWDTRLLDRTRWLVRSTSLAALASVSWLAVAL